MSKLLAVIRVRGTVGLRRSIRDTLAMLNLNRVNSCALVPATKEYRGMLQKVRSYVTFGEISQQILLKLLKNRVKVEHGERLTTAWVKKNTPYTSLSKLANALLKGKLTSGIRKAITLPPPRKGYEGIKRHYPDGALGYRGDKINDLLARMI